MIEDGAVSVKLIDIDPWLAPYGEDLRRREERFVSLRARLAGATGDLAAWADRHAVLGLHRAGAGWVCREFAPHARSVALIGEFSAWEVQPRFELSRNDDGMWSIELPPGILEHGALYKLVVTWEEEGRPVSGERIPAYARRVVQDPTTHIFSAQVWDPPEPYRWMAPGFTVSRRAPLIYEAHVGMSSEEPRVASYGEFTREVLPRIARAGYDTIQLMAIQEHPYYGSFGYQVSSLFAPSSRFGTPEELKALVDTAHTLGIAVIMDLVHSHAVRNEVEGLSRFDGSTTLYFHGGDRAEHPAWGTRLFDYGKDETLRLLLSNCRYWLEEFRFDGYRFDGVTSMIYRDHGLGARVTSYDHYFGMHIDTDALAYLTLANDLIHTVRPDALTVAEEVSAMPGLAAPRAAGGVGFDYRLAMGIPDYWIRLIKELPDEAWDVAAIWRELTAHRPEEQTISYAESHDQALVGDKTIIFRLADKEMYDHMCVGDQSLIIDRAIALHKLIRLVTIATAGHGYLNFMGNEFGHPEWVDFPRAGNGWSYHYCRRQWSLRDSAALRYRFLAEFDQAMVELIRQEGVLGGDAPQLVHEHVADQILAFSRGRLLFVFNFSPVNSYPGRILAVPPGSYTVVLDSDAPEFGGFDRVDRSLTFHSTGESGGLPLYLPSRTALVLLRR